MSLRNRSLAFLLSFAAAVAAQPPAAAPPTLSPDAVEAEVTTDAGTFRFAFLADKAPKHVENFISLVRRGYFDGGAFHRAIPGGIIQGGDPLLKDAATPRKLWGTGMGVPLEAELSDVTHQPGTVSAVPIPGKASVDGVQFFVCVTAQPGLDGKFTAFGRVTEGLAAVDRISRMPLSVDGSLEKPVRILKITIEPKRVEPFANATLAELHRSVTLETTLGPLHIKLEPDWAPETVRAFLGLVASGWYDGTAFHRLAKGFVLQGGMAETRAPAPDHFADRWVHPLKAEFRQDVKHVRGVLSLARYENDPNSGTTSFSIVLGDSPHLDGQYTAFGRVVNLDALTAFENEPVNGEAPVRRLEIVKATVDPEH